jgi:trimeric autotransporter adhesin
MLPRTRIGLASALLFALSLAPAPSLGASATLLEIRVIPGRASIFPGGAFAFEAKGTFSDGSTRDVTRKAQFAASPPNIADFVRKNVLLAEQAGEITVTATLGDVVSAPVPFTVSPITSLLIEPALNGVRLGSRFGWVVSAELANGADGFDVSNQVNWSSDDPDSLPIANKGSKKGLSRGAEITAAPVGLHAALIGSMLTATRDVSVVDPEALGAISVEPATRVIQLGDPFRFRAIGDFGGVLAEITLNVAWLSSNEDVATTAKSGVIKVRGFGTTTISVEDRETGLPSATNAQLIVVGDVSSLAIDPPAVALAVGEEEGLDAIADVEENVTNFDWSGRVDWTSSNPADVSVSGSGRVRCESDGGATITAREPRSGQSATADVTCSAAP